MAGAAGMSENFRCAAARDGAGTAVVFGDDGELIWRDEPVEGEQGVLADCEALVERASRSGRGEP